MAEPRVCESCGSKFDASRDRCPKCRALVVKVDAAAEKARSKQLAIGSGIVLAICVLAVGAIWYTQRPEPERPVTARPADPLAARRQPRAAEGEPGVAAAVDKPRPFMDPSGAATVSYSSGDYLSALAQFEAAIAKNPRDAESLSNLGQVLVRLERTEEAIPYFERACALNPDRWAYRFNLARALGLLQRWDESVASYRQAQQLFPADYVTTFNLALTLHKKGDDAAAIEEYKKAVDLNPEDASFRMAMAISYEALQQRQDAAAAYSEYLRLSPTAADADKVRARIALLTS